MSWQSSSGTTTSPPSFCTRVLSTSWSPTKAMSLRRSAAKLDSQQPQCTGTCNLNAKQPAISIPGSLPATTSLKMAHVIFYVDTDHGCWHAGCAQLCIESMLWNQACAWLHAHSMWVKELSCQKWKNKSTPRVTVFAECCVGEAG